MKLMKHKTKGLIMCPKHRTRVTTTRGKPLQDIKPSSPDDVRHTTIRIYWA